MKFFLYTGPNCPACVTMKHKTTFLWLLADVLIALLLLVFMWAVAVFFYAWSKT